MGAAEREIQISKLRNLTLPLPPLREETFALRRRRRDGIPLEELEACDRNNSQFRSSSLQSSISRNDLCACLNNDCLL